MLSLKAHEARHVTEYSTVPLDLSTYFVVQWGIDAFLRKRQAEREENLARRLRILFNRIIRQEVASAIVKAATPDQEIVDAVLDEHLAFYDEARLHTAWKYGKRVKAVFDPQRQIFLGTKTIQIKELIKEGRRDLAERIRDVLVEYEGTGATIFDLQRQIVLRMADTGVFSDGRAYVIARTETAQAGNYGSYRGIEDAGIKRIRWLTTMDGRERYQHGLMNNRTTEVGKPFRLPDGTKMLHPGEAGAPARHVVNCFPGDQLISGDVEACLRQLYRGDLITITFDNGNQLTGTPNHPILTPSGWRALGTIRHGDDLCGQSRTQNPAWLGCNMKNPVTTLEERFNFLSGSRSSIGARSSIDLYGDATNQKIDIVLSHRSFLFEMYSAIQQKIGQLLFGNSDISIFFGPNFGPALQLIGGPTLPPNGIVCGDDQTLTFQRRRHRHSGEHGLRSIPLIYADLVQMSDNDSATNLKMRSDGFNASPGREPRKNIFGGQLDSIPTYKVSNVSSLNFTGHVYTLQDAKGWYLCNGIVVKNCRCYVVPA